MRSMLATEVHRRLISDCNGRDPRSGAAPRSGASTLDGGTTPALASRLPVLGGYPAAMPRFAPPCAGPDCGDPPFRRRPPGSGLSCRKTGLNLTSFRGSGRLFRFLAAIRVDGCGITPGRKHSRRRCPVPQPTKPPRTLLGYFRSRISPSVKLPTKPPRALLGRYVGPWTALKTA